MADPLSVVASVAGIIQVALLATRELVNFAKDAKNATRDKRLLAEEASLLSNLLERLQQRTTTNEDKSWLLHHVELVRQFEGAFRDLAKALKIDVDTGQIPNESRWKSLLSSATWRFSKTEIYGLLHRLERLRQHSSALLSDAQTTILTHMDQQQQEALERKTMDEIMGWLSPLDMNRTHQSISDRVQPGSGEWFLTSEPFLSWSAGDDDDDEGADSDHLWCWGIPGAGKTVLASIVINHLRKTRGEDLRSDVGIAIIYLKYNEPEQTIDKVLGSVIKQLIQDSNVLDARIKDLYEHHRQRNSSPPLGSIEVLLHNVIEKYRETFIVIDGLDECEEDLRWSLMEYVGKLHGVRTLVTSRFLASIEEELEDFARFEIKANKTDIELFIDYQIQRNRNLRRMITRAPRLRDDIKVAVVKTAENMFLLARLHVESLASAASLTIRHVRQKLRELPTTLEASYDNAMQRISDQEEDRRRLAFKTLGWVTYAFRPLAFRELQHALAIEPGDAYLDEELLMDAPSVTALCAGLVVIDKATPGINLVHHSTKSYFERARERYFADYHASITVSLSTYLTLSALQNITISEIVQQYPLASYAAQYLGDHARQSPEESLAPAILEAICHLLTDPEKRKPLLTLLDGLDLIRSGYYSAQIPEDGDAISDNSRSARPSLDDDAALEALQTTTGRSASIGSVDVDKLSLTSSSVSVTTDDTLIDLTSNNWQVKFGQGRIPEVTALHLAASMGLAKVASMLLKETPNIDAVDENGKTALTLAMERGFEKAVEFLINGGAVVDLNDAHGRMLLLLIAEKDWDSVGDVLITRLQNQLNDELAGVDPQLQFLAAAYRGDSERISHLCRSEAIELKDNDNAIGDLALFIAVEHQDGVVIDSLLQAGVNIDAKDSKGQTALFRATRRLDVVTMKLLILDGIDVESRDDEGRTAWSANVHSKNKDVLDVLLRAGADPSTRGLQGVSPLYEAATDGDSELVRFLLESGTNPSVQTDYQWAPLHWAASYGHQECVQLLIDAGCDVNVQSDQGVTPLDLAIQSNRTEVIDLLRKAGANASKSEKKTTEPAWVRVGPPLSTAVSMAPECPVAEKLFLVFDKPLTRTLLKPNNIGQFLYPRGQFQISAENDFIYQVSHVLESNVSTIGIRRAVRRAEMDEYPLQVEEFNFGDVLYTVTSVRADFQDFELNPGVQTTVYDTNDVLDTSGDIHVPPSTPFRFHKDWTGNWKLHAMSTPGKELLFRTTPDWAAQSDSQDCRWMTGTTSLLMRSGWDDRTPNMCFEPLLELGVMDLLATCGILKLWSETVLNTISVAH